ncbi:MAG: M20/M25/M40 family metallo-hydrolase [Candidatus Eisenbacteria sp.]|nr:M20/M25/M40 family metallo-hydrolase [Candidatus Eisenbacteria bacterium]
MRAPSLAVAALCLVVVVATTAGAGSLYAVRLADGASLAAVEELGAVVRHVGLTEMIVEGDGGLGDEFAERGRVARRLAEPRAPELLYISYPRASADELARLGDVLWSEVDGAVLISCEPEYVDELRSLSYSLYTLPPSISVASWFDNTPPAHVRSRSRADERAVRGVVEDVISSISPDSLMAHVRALAEHPGGSSRSRYVLREECLTEAKPYIMDRLNEYLPTRAFIDTQRFSVRGYTCEDGVGGPILDYPADNIIGVLPGTGRLSGYYVVCAHYDAIAGNSFPDPITEPPWFWWCENPAPGADDNATGVATVLEAARALSDTSFHLSFPFDIRFVLFSGEELGLLGSTAYADSVAGYRKPDSAFIAPPDTIYGVLNVDMIAYKRELEHPDTCHIVTNPGSVWLANWIIATADSLYVDLFPGFEARRIDQALAYSDHAAFWRRDYDAIIAIEHWNPRDRNTNYHTIDDVVSTVYPSQLVSTARMVTGAVARLADPDGQFNLAVFADDVVFYATTGDGIRYHTDHFVIGEPGPMRVDFHAFGPDGYADVVLEVWDGPPDEGGLLSTASFAGTMGGGQVLTHEFEWELDDTDLGDHLLSVRLIVTGDDELTLSDNVVEGVPLRVDGPELFITDHFAWPNPARDISDLNLEYRLSRATEGSVEIKVFDLLGQEIAGTILYYRPGSENEGVLPGMNTVSWESLDATGGGLASGVYVYQITVYDLHGTEPADQTIGKLAIVR